MNNLAENSVVGRGVHFPLQPAQQARQRFVLGCRETIKQLALKVSNGCNRLFQCGSSLIGQIQALAPAVAGILRRFQQTAILQGPDQPADPAFIEASLGNHDTRCGMRRGGNRRQYAPFVDADSHRRAQQGVCFPDQIVGYVLKPGKQKIAIDKRRRGARS